MRTLVLIFKCIMCQCDGPVRYAGLAGEDYLHDDGSAPGHGEDHGDGPGAKRRRTSAGASLDGDSVDTGGAHNPLLGEAREVITYKKWGRGFKKIRTLVYGDAAMHGAEESKK
jgi:hypothetical protein